jgi:hypothetical protein
MRHTYNFVIDSEPSRHILSLNGRQIGVFATLDAARAEANKLAYQVAPGAVLNFKLDFKWTLSNLETRRATLERENGEDASHG